MGMPAMAVQSRRRWMMTVFGIVILATMIYALSVPSDCLFDGGSDEIVESNI